MKPFDVYLHYFDRHKLPESVEKDQILHFMTCRSDGKVCDVVTINCSLHPETKPIDDAMISKCRKGAYITLNIARGKKF